MFLRHICCQFQAAASSASVEVPHDPFALYEWDQDFLDVFMVNMHAFGVPSPFVNLPATTDELKAGFLENLAAEADDSEVGDRGILGIACKGEPSFAQFCAAVRRLSSSPWIVAVLAAAGAAGGAVAKIFIMCPGAAGVAGQVQGAFGGHSPLPLFE